MFSNVAMLQERRGGGGGEPRSGHSHPPRRPVKVFSFLFSSSFFQGALVVITIVTIIIIIIKVLKPTVSRDFFWNHSIKKWSDLTSPFILNGNIICFIAFLDVLVQKMVTKKHIKIRNPGPHRPLFRTFSLNLPFFTPSPSRFGLVGFFLTNFKCVPIMFSYEH